MFMRLTVSTHAFEAVSLETTLVISKMLGFKGVDIAGFHKRGRCSYEPDEVGAAPQKFADDLNGLLQKYGLDAVDFFPQFGVSFDERSINDPDPSVRQKNFDSMRGIAKFCKLAGIPGVTVLPGVNYPDRPLDENLKVAGESLKKYVDICGEQGVLVRFEPHMGSVADTPELALRLVELAPGALITLDYSHYTLQYIPVERIHAMIPHTGHVHIRPAKPGKLQTKFAEGTIDFVDVAKRLEAAGYKYCLSIEFVYIDWYDANQLDTLTETVITK